MQYTSIVVVFTWKESEKAIIIDDELLMVVGIATNNKHKNEDRQ